MVNWDMMKPQLAPVILMAVLLATFMNMNSAIPCLGEAPSHPPEHDPQDSKENNTTDDSFVRTDDSVVSTDDSVVHTDDSVVREKAYQPPSASENLIYFATGVLVIMMLIFSCHLIFAAVCKTDRMHERGFDRMLNNDRNRGHQYDQVARWARDPPSIRFPTHPEISPPLPLVDMPSSSQVLPQDPFFNKVHENLRSQFEDEGDFALGHVRGPRAPRRVTISSPCVTRSSHY